MESSESRSAVVLELAEEFLDRYRHGQRPSLKEYVDRHPELAVEIRDVFPAMAMMENIALADESMAGEATGGGPDARAAAAGAAGRLPHPPRGRPRRHGRSSTRPSRSRWAATSR